MKWFKFFMFVLVLGLVGLFIFQNLPAFQAPLDFQYDLGVASPLTWELSVYVIIFISALAGLLIGIIVMLKPYFHVRRLLANERNERQQIQKVSLTKEPSEPLTDSSPPDPIQTSQSEAHRSGESPS